MSREVLVVDDDEEIRLSLCEILEDEGYSAIGLKNGREALEYLRTRPAPQLVFLDLMMPEVDGWEVLRQRQEDACLSRIPFCVITAGGPHQRAGVSADRLLDKPLRLEDVLAVAEELVPGASNSASS